MSGWPLIKIKLESEDVSLNEVGKLKSLFQQLSEVVLEEERAHKVVLVLDDILDHGVDCFYLVISQSVVNWGSVIKTSA